MPLVRVSPHAERQRAEGEAAFLAAAEALVDEGSSYGELAIGAIAKRAGFSRASFYAYFTDKRALAAAVGERFQLALGGGIDEWLRGEDATGPRPTVVRTLEVFVANRGAALLLAETAGYDPEIAELWRAIHLRFSDLARERIGRTAPDLSPALAAARATALTWGTQATIVEHLRHPEHDPAVLADALTTIWDAVFAA